MKWEQLQQSGQVPEPRSSHSITHIPSASKLFLFGGEHDPRTPINNEMYSYDVASGTWNILAATGTRPEPRVAHTAVVPDGSGTILYFGGRSGKEMGEGAFDDLHAFDTANSAWSLITDTKGPLPPKRSYHTATAAGGCMYIFGGCGAEGRLADLHQFDTRAHTWSALPGHDAIKGRGGSCLVASADDRQLYVLAGFCGHELADAFCYDLAAGKWHEGPSLAFGRSVLGAIPHASSSSACHGGGISCGHAGHFTTFGGEVDPSAAGHEGAGEFTADLTCLDPVSGTWHKLDAGSSEGPCARGWFAYASLGGDLLVHGGLNCANERLGDMFVLRSHA